MLNTFERQKNEQKCKQYIGEELARLREAHQLSIDDVSNLTRLAPSTIRRMEKGEIGSIDSISLLLGLYDKKLHIEFLN